MKRSTLIAICFAASLLLLLFLLDGWPALRFRGDGRFTGGPVFGYKIAMQGIPFYTAKEYTFRCHGVPTEDMSLQLYAEGKSGDDRNELTHLGTTIDARLTDGNGKIICQAIGLPHDGQDDNNWVLMSGSDVAAFWHKR